MKTPEVDGVAVERRRALLVLEVLAGLRSAPQAAEELNMPLQSYYQLEERAVKGLVAACEPQPPGPRRNYEKEAAELVQERDRLRQECARYQALVRTSQLSVGLNPDKPVKKSSKKRHRRPTVRALRAIGQIESKTKSK